MATSTIQALRKALHARLVARGGLSGVQISLGIPTSKPEPEWIMIGGARDPGDQEAAALGQLRREEHYHLWIDVSVVRPFDDDQVTTTDRAFALAAEVEDELRSDASVGGVVRIAQVVGMALAEPADATEREGRIVMRIDVRQRI